MQQQREAQQASIVRTCYHCDLARVQVLVRCCMHCFTRRIAASVHFMMLPSSTRVYPRTTQATAHHVCAVYSNYDTYRDQLEIRYLVPRMATEPRTRHKRVLWVRRIRSCRQQMLLRSNIFRDCAGRQNALNRLISSRDYRWVIFTLQNALRSVVCPAKVQYSFESNIFCCRVPHVLFQPLDLFPGPHEVSLIIPVKGGLT